MADVAAVKTVAFLCHVPVLLCHSETLISGMLEYAVHSNLTVLFTYQLSNGDVKFT